jgi:hypothetical protein
MTSVVYVGGTYIELRDQGCICVVIDRSPWSWTWNANDCPLHDSRLTPPAQEQQKKY